ncbi:3-deoxy-manno-octulosonate cytidylyltransferase [Rhizobium sp. P32RR-XVIII]|uniref:3-deoxy-manno-octulosonate cytidylyltransferase n=1 Tax=Rhizobium sp. P32RR-XVIII TaxID=2726738 RepID=UPI001456B4F6|nr:3-deoxy-manno-octulosonate cytidylyltransferase [Rhizobium sp. P32RR-XVIII]NLS06762.1 3-deoxy-manno-octulosonate cytidylyltransferase [Rhizobium sp. P32RR-XVIII]
MNSNPMPLNFRERDEWRQFFSSFSHIVLVGNSDRTEPFRLTEAFPQSALFVFFNKVYKVLNRSFDRPSLLVARSGTSGANIVHRKEVKDVLSFFPEEALVGIVNIRVAPSEQFSPKSAFEGAKVYHLDLTSLTKDYPAGKIPTSGFALTLWLRDLQPAAEIVLAGFSGTRGETWKVFNVHDWTYEQVFLRLCAKRGEIAVFNQDGDVTRAAALLKSFPDMPPAELLMEMTAVLAERQDSANDQIDRLMSVTKFQRGLDALFRRIRPKTRKQREQARLKKDPNS